MLHPTEALDIILASVSQVGTEKVPLEESLGRTLADDVRAAEDLPPFDNSAMDGYAVRAADTAGASEEHPALLRVLEDLPAGGVPRCAVGAGEAVRIMTGAPVPAGA
ncbi:MAG: molybdopterin molybdenumtransferase MoeA, partial [Armatimonadetes bacterium]|nr:molybdopterin molybdenumtransferase MoeA [Armatimonadota bacterium]